MLDPDEVANTGTWTDRARDSDPRSDSVNHANGSVRMVRDFCDRSLVPLLCTKRSHSSLEAD